MHPTIVYAPDYEEEFARARVAFDAILDVALSLGGTVTGEHGIGLHKMGFLVEEAGEPAVAAMRALKAALDPTQILNPGKVFALNP